MDATRLLSSLAGTLGRTARRARGGANLATTAISSHDDGAEAPPRLDLAGVDDDEALLLVRTMIAAAAADGVVDGSERERIHDAMRDSGLDPADRAFLDEEISWPRDIEEIADAVGTPEKAARTYAAARLVIEPDTMQEREFLRLLAERMDLQAGEVAAIEERFGGK
ncbi:DUF533 domain-containing protein [Salinarimonas ramus]|uniref:Tellurite resistance protein TerB n=1 Tax=Salinarimonas ramus TaxID=690164 RepID=A0A917QBH2_9HYPH|nr:DUF533 domain-containing protein [Salinarimonas ramus]GGK41132.1 hypothetical protein GCM10011322_30330 [Salinarimonas ramus]